MTEIETRLREALAEPLEASPPASGDWLASRNAGRRRLAVRRGGVATLVLATFATAVSLSTGDRPQSFVGPSISRSAAARPQVLSPAIPNQWRRYTDRLAGFTMRYPADWEGPDQHTGGLFTPAERYRYPFSHGDGEYVEEMPQLMEISLGVSARPGTPSCEEYRRANPEEFTGAYLAEHEDYCARDFDERLEHRNDRLRDAGAEVVERRVIVGGRPGMHYEITYPDTPPPVSAVSWCPGCRATEFVIDWSNGWWIELRMVSPDAKTYERFVSEGIKVATSVAPTG